MAEFAERYAITRIVVLADAPRDDVCCIDCCMMICCKYANAAYRTTMAVCFDHCSTKSLIAYLLRKFKSWRCFLNLSIPPSLLK